ncbi:cell division protein FtsZ [Aestuariispira insulae]|uniref:Cell division protein FtsZ n=1 Tax=Aestuariispira insulae TaxID=1461337 RepID=A0A3D9HXI1_9PROT|nr:cell division protein FtsZ [Aestuariispira insulae]RED54120.1 cell division protein FtsZ [Aestuariispira insulae]
MALNLSTPQAITELKPRIVVVGVGGAGGNAVDNMIHSNLEGVEFFVANTDAQALEHSSAERKIQLGTNITQGLGAGARPEIGRAAAEEALEEVMAQLDGANMVFITAGMGGGTGTGAAPVIAEAARKAGILTVGVITKPFHFEGSQRMRLAEAGIEELQQFVDTLIIIPNQNLFRVANEKTTFADAFKMADDVLHSGVRGVTDLMIMPGLINLDFADIRTVMGEMGKAMMGTGEAEGETRAITAAEAAIANPLLEDVTMKGARGVLINITGGADMTLFEVDEAANRIREEVDQNANIIFGSTFDENLNGSMRVSVVATGIEAEVGVMPRPAAVGFNQPKSSPVVQAAVEAATRRHEEESAAEVALDVETSLETDQPADAAPLDTAAELNEEAAQDFPVEEIVAEDTAAPVETVENTLFDLGEPTPAPEAAPTAEDTRPAPRPAPVATRDAFIPPSPVQAAETREFDGEQPDPFAEADYANAGRDQAQQKAPKRSNLFRRMTGLVSGRENMGGKPETVSQFREEPGLSAIPQPEEKPAQSSADEEMLEIPAFLRRQAN